MDCLLKRVGLFGVLAVSLPVISLRADEPKPTPIAEIKRDKPVEFAEVQKIFAKNCQACHSGSKQESGLNLESPEAMRKGGDNGPAVVAKKGDASYLLKLASHQEEPVMPPLDNKVNAAKLTPEELGLIKLWIDQGAEGQSGASSTPLAWQPLPAGVQPIVAVAMTPDGQLVACGRGNEISVYEAASGRLVARLVDPNLTSQSGPVRQGIAHLDVVQALAFSPSGDLLASGAFREVKVWQRPRNVRRGELAGATEVVSAVAVSADGKWAATGELNGTIKVWELASHQSKHTLAGHGGAITGLRFSLDNAKLFSSSKDKTLRAWKLADGAAAGKIDAPAESNGIALVNEGNEIVSADADNTLRVWALPVEPAPPEAPKPLKELKGHGGPVTAVDSQLPQGKTIVSGSQDGTVRKWNYDNAQQTQQLDPGGPVQAVAIRADGKRIASANSTNAARLFNGENGQVVAEFKGDHRDRFAVAELERKLNVARGRVNDGKNAVNEAEQLAKKESEAVPKAAEAKVAADKALAEKTEALKKPSESKLAAEKELESTTTALAQANEALAKAKEAAEKETSNQELAKARDVAQNAANEADQKQKQAQEKVKAAKQPFEQAEREMKNAQSAAESAARNLDASQKASQKAAEAVPVAKTAQEQFEAAQKQAEATVETGKKSAAEREKPIRIVAFSTDGNQLVTGGDNGVIVFWSAETGAPGDVLTGQGESIAAAAFTPAGTLVAAANNKSVVHWDTQAAWVLVRTIGKVDDATVFQDRVLALDFSPDGKLLLAGGGEPSRSGELKLWNVADGTLARAIKEPHSDTIFAARFSPSGDRIATSAADRFIKLWNVTDGAFIRALEGHTHHVLGVAWRLDGKMLASGSADNTMKVWDSTTGEQKRTIQGLQKEVTSLVFVGDSPRAIVSAGDNTVRLYNMDSGGNERNFGGSADYVYSAAASADGKLVAGGGQDGVLRLWNGENAQVVSQIEPAKAN